MQKKSKIVLTSLNRSKKVLKLSAVVGHLSRIVKTWKDTESDTKRGIEEMLPICFKGFPPPVGSPEPCRYRFF